MSTLRRELRQKFEEILIPALSDNPQTQDAEDCAKGLAEKCADTAISVFEESKKPAKPTNDPMWNLLHGIDITQEDIDNNVLVNEATSAFERDIKFNPLPWSSTKDWEKLSKFVVQEYQKDKLIFSRYKTWQQNEGKYLAMSNRKIKERPADFIACWPDFLAHSAMYSSQPTQQSFVENDENGVPKSY